MAESATIHPPPGAGIPALRYSLCVNATRNLSLAFCLNDTVPDEEASPSLDLIQRIVAIVVPLLFGIIVFVGLIGNALVSIGREDPSFNCLSTYPKKTLTLNCSVTTVKFVYNVRKWTEYFVSL
jgi:hypothetical protein